MAGPDDLPTLRLVFGKAFLVELNRGNLEGAQLFARAFLLQQAPPRVSEPSAGT